MAGASSAAAPGACLLRAGSPRDLLVIKPSSLGDVVHTLPAVALIKRHFPGSRLRWLVNPEWAPLLEGNPYVDEVIHFPRSTFRGVRGLWRFPSWARHFAAGAKADLVLDFQGLLRSGWLARLARNGDGRSSVIGLSDAREGAAWFYDHAVDVRGCLHAVERYLAIVRALGIAVPAELEWPLPAGVAAPGVEPGFVLLHPFSRGKGKSLALEDITAICECLAPRPVVVAGRADTALPSLPNVIDLLNRTTISQLVWLIRQACFVVSVDSGPMHIAAAATGRLLSIHTWSDPRKVGPYRPDAWVWKAGCLSSMGVFLPGSPPAVAPHEIALPSAVAELVSAAAGK